MQYSFLCFSRQPKKAVWEDPGEYPQMAMSVQGTIRSFRIMGTEPVKAALWRHRAVGIWSPAPIKLQLSDCQC